MASKQPFKLFDTKRIAIKLWLKVNYFVKYSLLFQKKHILVVGDQQSEIYQHFTSKIQSGWTIHTVKQTELAYPHENVHQKGSNQAQNYHQIEQRLQNKLYESIVVLPSSNNSNYYNFQDQNFATQFPNNYLNHLVKNLFAYKMACKYLSKTGIIVLSCNEKQFLNVKPFEYEQFGRGKEKPQEVKQNKRPYTASACLVDGAVAYLGVILGQRYDLSLNSNTVIALTSELSTEVPQPVANVYARWVNRKGLPSPGSFARFQPPSEKASTYYVEYI